MELGQFRRPARLNIILFCKFIFFIHYKIFFFTFLIQILYQENTGTLIRLQMLNVCSNKYFAVGFPPPPFCQKSTTKFSFCYTVGDFKNEISTLVSSLNSLNIATKHGVFDFYCMKAIYPNSIWRKVLRRYSSMITNSA